MWKCAVVAYAVSVSSSVTLAGAIIDVVPLSPPPYAGGQRVEVQVRLTQQRGGQDIYLRGVQLDFEDTDPALRLDDVFTFDYTGQAICAMGPSQCGANYIEFARTMDNPLGSWVAAVYIGWPQDSLRQIRLPSVGSIPIGTVGLTLPTAPGDYLLDVINSDTPHPGDRGAAIHFGFGGSSDPMTTWDAGDEAEIAGGRFTAVTTADADVMFGYTPISGAITPEPMSLILLAMGGLAALRLRKRRV